MSMFEQDNWQRMVSNNEKGLREVTIQGAITVPANPELDNETIEMQFREWVVMKGYTFRGMVQDLTVYE